MLNLVNMLEAILFAAGMPLSRQELFAKMPEDISKKNLNDALSKIAVKYSGDSWILLQQFGDKFQFCSNDKYGTVVSEVLQPVKEKELSKSLMEVLSIIAYFQPITRAEIEQYRGDVAADYALAMLTKAGLIDVGGIKQAPGRPILYVTTDNFLKKFDLKDLSDLPSQDEVKQKMYTLGFNKVQGELYREDGKVDDDEDEMSDFAIQQAQEFEDYLKDYDDTPEFLKDTEYTEYSGDDFGETISGEEVKTEELEEIEEESDELPT